MKTYFVTGIGTEVGKTVVSAILIEKFKADYWKPVQAGTMEETDSQRIKALSTLSTKCYPESYCLKEPVSPHVAAMHENIEISLFKILQDYTAIEENRSEKNLIIEGAGGLMVPLNGHDLFIDLMEKLRMQVIIVSRNYLGSINHTLLTVEVLSARCIDVAGIIFVGKTNKETEDFILSRTKLPCLGRIPESEKIDRQFIEEMQEHLIL